VTTLKEKGKEPPKYHLTLYIAGNEPNSQLAIRNLRAICSGDLTEQCMIKIVDVYQDFQRALKDRVVITPTLIVATEKPTTKVTFYGTLHGNDILLKYLKTEAIDNE